MLFAKLTKLTSNGIEMKRVHDGATKTTVNKSTARNNGQPEKTYVIKRTETGLGFITLKPITKGTRIIEYFGPLVPNEEVEKRTGKYFFELNDKFSVDGSPRDNIARYINHSCRPNAEAIISRNERIWIWAKRDIKVGEEITYDYGKDYFENVIKPMGCRCIRCKSRD